MTDLSPAQARTALILLLQRAHAGELAAARAYQGHAASWWARRERLPIREIEADEWRHRREVGHLLTQLGAAPAPPREALMWTIGTTIGLLCHLGGWLIPMYGAAVLERDNVCEYETAARLAIQAQLADFVPCLLEMAEKEWDHQAWFMARVHSHFLARRLPWLWNRARIGEAREAIRQRIESLCRPPELGI